jgi:phosphoribosylamine-glycine ligase
MKQFFYTRLVKTEKEESKNYLDSFNLDMVIRTVELDGGKRLVVLNDFHEETREKPIINKQHKITGYKNQKDTYQSEIVLEPEDAEKYVNLYK